MVKSDDDVYTPKELREWLEREVRDEVSRSAVATRQELTQTLATFQRTLLAQPFDARTLILSGTPHPIPGK